MSGHTSMGGDGGRLPSTTISLLARWNGSTPPDVRPVVEAISAQHWKAVYFYFRAERGRSNEEAKDLAQAFFLWLLETDALARFVPTRGNFRHFFKMLLGNFFSNQNRGLNTLRRGGGVTIVPMGAELDLPAPESPDPERSFDHAWFEGISKQAADRVRERLVAEGREPQWKVYEALDLAAPEARPSYDDLARRFGLSEQDVRNHLYTVRKTIRGEIRAGLAKLTADDSELEEEWNAFFGA